MNDIIEFLTSEEMGIVGCIILISTLLVFVVYIFEKNCYKRKQKHNTKELNNLVSDIKEVQKIETDTTENFSVQQSEEEIKEEKPLVIPIEELEPVEEVVEEVKSEETKATIEQIYSDVKEEVESLEELQYTNIEPNQEEAKEELKKLAEDLMKQEQENGEKNIELTKFEEEQEENAIISMDELMKKENELYEKNEVSQYEDEGNEPISLQDLELRMNHIKEEIENIEIAETIEEITESKEINPVEETTNKVVLDDFNTIDYHKNAYRDDIVFKSSPIISPIFGIENKVVSSNDMMLENTANYEKLDEEIKKTNEFLVTLKELQKKLD